MISTRIEISYNKLARMADLADLAEVLFPGNRNQQHAFFVVWITLKWQHCIVPNLSEVAAQHHVSRRTMERVRAKLRRLGLIEHVSRLSSRFGYREGWVLSTRFERGLHELADKVAGFKDDRVGSREKDSVLLEFAALRRAAVRNGSEATGGEKRRN